jgi:hypothetical protein
MAGTSEGGKKSADTRGHESLSEVGKKGEEYVHGGKGKSMEGKDEGRTGSSSINKDK